MYAHYVFQNVQIISLLFSLLNLESLMFCIFINIKLISTL